MMLILKAQRKRSRLREGAQPTFHKSFFRESQEGHDERRNPGGLQEMTDSLEGSLQVPSKDSKRTLKRQYLLEELY